MELKTVQTQHVPVRYLEGGSGEPLASIDHLTASFADWVRHFIGSDHRLASITLLETNIF